MWIPVLLCLFAAVADYGVYGWKTGHIYKYDFKTCSLYRQKDTTVTKQFFKADMSIQPLSSDILSSTIQNIRKKGNRDIKEMEQCGTFPSDELNFTSESFNSNPLETSFKNGSLTSLKVNRNLQHADRNLVMLVAEQLQLSLQGENCGEPKSCRSSPEIKPNAVYQVTENTVGGNCATQYEVSLLPESNLQRKSNENGPFFVVVKTTDYKKCKELSKDPEADNVDSFTHSKRIIVSGNKEEHTIQAINSTIRVAVPLGPKHISTPILLLNMNITLISTDPTDGHPQNISNPKVFDSLSFQLG